MKPSPKVRTAYHEAGHAATAFHFHRAVRKVTIVPGEGYVGRMIGNPSKARPDIYSSGRQRTQLEEQIKISMAGEAAECVLVDRKHKNGYWNGGSRNDFENIANHLIHLAGTGEMYAPYFDLLWFQTLGTVRIVLWPPIEALAAALLEQETLTGKEARKVCESNRYPKDWFTK